ncbi:hypothetical protein EVAR_49169_1 [Eumeta japonica]|uniref:Uncharacterized protein n=1 Tax=Eumeta variegata TaxID=151549 RepID=A0A4C1YJH8_EUMVA|nr:hypothetical protein EVAR_49169_1 [Eumeta japonica]
MRAEPQTKASNTNKRTLARLANLFDVGTRSEGTFTPARFIPKLRTFLQVYAIAPGNERGRFLKGGGRRRGAGGAKVAKAHPTGKWVSATRCDICTDTPCSTPCCYTSILLVNMDGSDVAAGQRENRRGTSARSTARATSQISALLPSDKRV